MNDGARRAEAILRRNLALVDAGINPMDFEKRQRRPQSCNLVGYDPLFDHGPSSTVHTETPDGFFRTFGRRVLYTEIKENDLKELKDMAEKKGLKIFAETDVDDTRKYLLVFKRGYFSGEDEKAILEVDGFVPEIKKRIKP